MKAVAHCKPQCIRPVMGERLSKIHMHAESRGFPAEHCRDDQLITLPVHVHHVSFGPAVHTCTSLCVLGCVLMEEPFY